jgi:hypothetical protein
MWYHHLVARWARVLDSARRGPANVSFDDLCSLVERIGYVKRRQTGSHRIYRHPARPDLPLINLQRSRSGKAKPYQVRQVLDIIDTYNLEVSE